MSAYLSPVFGAGAQLFNNQGVVLSGGKIWTYQAGTTTPLATWTDSTQVVVNANPIILDSAGRASTEIWFQSGSTYKIILTDSNNNVLGTWDNLAGINDIVTSVTVTEWSTTSLTPSYISSTSFSVPGNNTSVFPINRRVKIVVSAGTVYGYVTASSFGSGITTVTILPDSTVLDSGISSVNVGLLSPTNPSYPQQLLAMNAPVSITAASTTNIGAALSANILITGTTTITAFDTVLAGIIRFVKFNGILTLTHNGTSLILPGAANITTVAGDQAIFRSLGSGNWECLNYQITSFAPSHVALADSATTATTATNATNVTGDAVVTGSLGYASGVGAGGTVAQSGTINTGVTLSKRTGRITCVSKTFSANASESFILTNSTMSAHDLLMVSGSDTGNTLIVTSSNILSDGTHRIVITNPTAFNYGPIAISIYFVVIDGSID